MLLPLQGKSQEEEVMGFGWEVGGGGSSLDGGWWVLGGGAHEATKKKVGRGRGIMREVSGGHEGSAP